nr:DNA-protecting protein DprA [Bacteroidota bacterium]
MTTHHQDTNTEELKYKIASTLIAGVGNMLAKTLVSYCGSFEAIFKEKKSHLEKIPGVGPVTCKKILAFKDFDRTEKEIEFIRKYKIQAWSYLDKQYPDKLRQCFDSPVMIYFKGNCDFNLQPCLAFVGTRKATDYGKQLCEEIIEALIPYNVNIISGLAYGIDICAHKQALKCDITTVGVLAHGIDKIYPPAHRSVAEKMLHNGGLITEYISETNPDRENFPTRNRIIAGLCNATIVIEAGERGGALITAEIANSYNRDVFAIPGRSTDEYSKGCNRLIKLQKAQMVESAADICYQLGWQNDAKAEKEKHKQVKLFIDLTPDEKTIYDFLINNDQSGIDNICIACEMSTSRTAAALLSLEFAGLVKSMPGKIFKSL